MRTDKLLSIDKRSFEGKQFNMDVAKIVSYVQYGYLKKYEARKYQDDNERLKNLRQDLLTFKENKLSIQSICEELEFYYSSLISFINKELCKLNQINNVKIDKDRFSYKALGYACTILGITFYSTNEKQIFLDTYCENNIVDSFNRYLHYDDKITELKGNKTASTRHLNTLEEAERFADRYIEENKNSQIKHSNIDDVYKAVSKYEGLHNAKYYQRKKIINSI